jgi:hypothetical protein
MLGCCCCDESSQKDKDAIDVMPVGDESMAAISFQPVDDSAPFPQSSISERPVTPGKRRLSKEQTLDAKEKLQDLIRTFVKEAAAGFTVMRVDVDVATSASLSLDKKLKVMQAISGGKQVDIPLVGAQFALLKDSPKAAARNPDETVVSIVSNYPSGPSLDWLVQFGSAKTASDFVIALKVLQEAAKKAA